MIISPRIAIINNNGITFSLAPSTSHIPGVILSLPGITGKRDQLHVVIDHLQVGTMRFNPGDEVVQQVLRMGRAGRDRHYAQRRRLPQVIEIHFGSADVEFFVQARDQPLEDAPLGFEGIDSGEAEFNTACTNEHGLSAVDQRTFE